VKKCKGGRTGGCSPRTRQGGIKGRYIGVWETARVRGNQPTEGSLGEDLIELGSTGNSTTHTVQGTSGWEKHTQ